jgi:hypothetical protein
VWFVLKWTKTPQKYHIKFSQIYHKFILVTNHILNKVIFNGKIYYFVNKIFSAKDKFVKIQYDISGEFLSILKQTA